MNTDHTSAIRPVLRTTPILVAFLFATSLAAQSPPLQPDTGPGGADYLHGAVDKNGPYWAAGHLFDRNFRYYTYEPDRPKPSTAPVVLFLHGWLAYNPAVYEAWIQHIVRMGYVVVWVQYDSGLRPPWVFADNAMVAWRDALGRLDRDRLWDRHVRPEVDSTGRFKTAMVGHSAGGFLSAILAARAADPANKIPRPQAVVAVEPGGLGIIPDADFSTIDPATKMTIIVGEEDTIVCQSTAVQLWSSTPQILAENRDFLLVHSDYEGSPAQVANHYFPSSIKFGDTADVDARDYFVTYKLSVGTLNCAFRGTDCEFALGNGSNEQLDMGEWSNGVVVKPMAWIADPATLDTPCNGQEGFLTRYLKLLFSRTAADGRR
jgi:pimeloyl-ACP methyl ester carboxylesterase